ncbi:MAG: hypothetical protein Q8Q33_00710, partial [Chlamydiota bacterium]|nr:hypothetical protein [Chlamydiota bacterium]
TNKPVFFDHIEVHVTDIPKYCDFLQSIFQGGRYKVISDSGTSMFVSQDGINIEIKKKKTNDMPDQSGFCNPCLRMENAKDFIEQKLNLQIDQTMKNPDGNCYFFKDHEGITWHIKEYLVRDKFINW